MKLGEFFKQKRLARGLSQDELARLVGIHRLTVSRYERGYQVPTLRDLMVMKRFLRFKWSELDQFDFDERLG